MVIDKQINEHLEASLHRRRATAPKPVDNSAMYAEKPMIFYCKICGWVSDIKPEDYLGPVRLLCSECEFALERRAISDPSVDGVPV